MIPLPIPKVTVRVTGDADPDEDYYPELRVTINGGRCKKLPNDDGSRLLFFSKRWNVLIKVDTEPPYPDNKTGRVESCSVQCVNEFALWTDELEPDDRQFFVPIYAAGQSVGADERLWWCMEPFIPDFDGLVTQTKEARRMANGLAKKYKIGDWSDRQWKQSTTDNVPIIHDYGYHNSGLRKSSQRLVAA